MRKYLILIFLLISGCAYNNSFIKKDFNHFDYKYVKRENCLNCLRSLPEYHFEADKNIITQQEYRRLPSYLQECYERDKI